MTRPNLTNKHKQKPLTEMVRSLMSGHNTSFVNQASQFLSSDTDTVAETQIAVSANRLNQPRWWKQFVGEHVTEESAQKVKTLMESGDYRSPTSTPDPAAIKVLASRLKTLLSRSKKEASAFSVLVADRRDAGYNSEPGEPHFHLGQLVQDLEEDLALAENLCEAVVRVTDPRVVSNTYQFLTEQAQGLLAGAEVVAVLADRFYEVTGAATGQ